MKKPSAYELCFGVNPVKDALLEIIQLPKEQRDSVEDVILAEPGDVIVIRTNPEKSGEFESVDMMDVEITYSKFPIPERFKPCLNPFLSNLDYKLSTRFENLTTRAQAKQKAVSDPLSDKMRQDAEAVRAAIKSVLSV